MLLDIFLQKFFKSVGQGVGQICPTTKKALMVYHKGLIFLAEQKGLEPSASGVTGCGTLARVFKPRPHKTLLPQSKYNF